MATEHPGWGRVGIAVIEIYHATQSKECGKHSLVCEALEACLQCGLLEFSTIQKPCVW